jgi:hypothetical protein
VILGLLTGLVVLDKFLIFVLGGLEVDVEVLLGLGLRLGLGLLCCLFSVRTGLGLLGGLPPVLGGLNTISAIFLISCLVNMRDIFNIQLKLKYYLLVFIEFINTLIITSFFNISKANILAFFAICLHSSS